MGDLLECPSEARYISQGAVPEVVKTSADMAPGVGVGRLLENLGPDVLTILAAPRGLDGVVTEAVLHDPVVGQPLEAGDLVLAIGTSPASEEALRLMHEFGAAQVAAVAFKLAGRPSDSLVEAAVASGVVLLGARPEVPWTRLYSLIQTALAGRPSDPDIGVDGVGAGDLFALADAIAATVGGPTVITDSLFRTLAYSNLDHPIDDARLHSIVDRRPLDAILRRVEADGLPRRLKETEGILRVDQYSETGLRPRLAAPVRAAGEVLGFLWVIEGDVRFGKAAERALSEAASIAALHLIRHRNRTEIEQHLQREMLLAVLDGGSAADGLASQLGFVPDEPVTVLAYDLV